MAPGPNDVNMNTDAVTLAQHVADITQFKEVQTPTNCDFGTQSLIDQDVFSADFLASGHIVKVSSSHITISKVIHLSFHIPASVNIFMSTYLSILDVSLDLAVSSYISDESTLFFLASILFGQDGTLIGPQKPLVPYSDDEDDDIQLVAPFQPTSRKRRARKLKEPINVKFVRHSSRLNNPRSGFISEQAMVEAADFPNIYQGTTAEAVLDPAPHLSSELIKGIATRFLQIQPEAVSAAVLEELDE